MPIWISFISCRGLLAAWNAERFFLCLPSHNTLIDVDDWLHSYMVDMGLADLRHDRKWQAKVSLLA